MSWVDQTVQSMVRFAGNRVTVDVISRPGGAALLGVPAAFTSSLYLEEVGNGQEVEIKIARADLGATKLDGRSSIRLSGNPSPYLFTPTVQRGGEAPSDVLDGGMALVTGTISSGDGAPA